MRKRLAVLGLLIVVTALYALFGPVDSGADPRAGLAGRDPVTRAGESEPWVGLAVLAGLVLAAAAMRFARRSDPLHAGFLRRAGALLIDLWVLWLVAIGIAMPAFARGLVTMVDLVGLDVVVGSMGPAMTGGVAVLGAGIALVYWTVLHARSRRTVGKYVADVVVVDARTLAGIGHGRALGRVLAMAAMALLTALTAGLGAVAFVWPVWDRRRQAAHDKIARTVVVRPGERLRHLDSQTAGQPAPTGAAAPA